MSLIVYMYIELRELSDVFKYSKTNKGNHYL